MPSFKTSKSGSGEKVTLEITNRTVLRVVLIVVAVLLGLALARQAAYPLMLIFVAFFLTLAFNAPVHWIESHLPSKRRGSRPVAMGVSFLAVLLLLLGFLAAIVPPLVREAGNFIDAAPGLVEQARDQNTPMGQIIDRFNLEERVTDGARQLSGELGNFGATAASAIGSVAGSVVAVFTVLVLTFMMLLEGPRWTRVFKEVIPAKNRPRVEKITGDMYRVVKGYVNGQVLLAFLTSIVVLPALIVLGIPYPAALVVIVFICGLIPLVGNTIGAVIISLVALTQSWLVALIILSYYILYQMIENYIIQPRVQANSTNMSPLLVFGSVIIGVSFGGILGALVAIPVAGCIRIALIDYLRGKGIIKPNDVDTGQVKPGLTPDTK